MTPTQRTRAYLKARGVTNQIVEHWIAIPGHPAGGTRRDLFGCIDVVALLGGEIVGIQTCAGASHAARKAKIEATPEMGAWAAHGGGIELWSWAKRGDRGNRKLWTLRREVFDRSTLGWRELPA